MLNLSKTFYFQAPLQQSTTIQCLTKEVTDAKSDETSDQPEEEYGFMEALKLDSDDDDEVENVPKTVNDVVPNRQKTPEDYAQNEDDVLNMESITMDSEDKDEVKIEVKEDKTPQVIGFSIDTGQYFQNDCPKAQFFKAYLKVKNLSTFGLEEKFLRAQ